LEQASLAWTTRRSGLGREVTNFAHAWQSKSTTKQIISDHVPSSTCTPGPSPVRVAFTSCLIVNYHCSTIFRSFTLLRPTLAATLLHKRRSSFKSTSGLFYPLFYSLAPSTWCHFYSSLFNSPHAILLFTSTGQRLLPTRNVLSVV
jgi:hypothetical protein